MHALLLIVVIAAVGCAQRGTDCAGAAANAMKVSHDALAKIDGMQSRLGELTDGIALRCTQDRWSSEVVGCLGRATTEPELQRCQRALTPAQQHALETAMMRTMGMGGGGGGGAGGGGLAEPPAPR